MVATRRSSKPAAAVQKGAFGDRAPIHDRAAEPLVACVDPLEKRVAGIGVTVNKIDLPGELS
jgi:hypothetical protein